MNNAVPNRTVAATVIALLALAQAAFGVLRALGWFHTGSDLMGRGLLLLPLIGVVAYATIFFNLVVVNVFITGLHSYAGV